ncbi:DUF1997 domain-containing protein [Gloeobacter kilaueensis]|uniref:Uncharacterized protein n=1 Tax=Gloeobacter kilaueensis (strain ATCC BAA-2537 / CCAP 1431/1 / ULC 316 / JS1) TaxID=1183438 RepID=U5QFA9_GLOK1|nr:DUF1997 domain-containing protein [Gloeobacter kilaueensis]AGY57657.1 hypothetical protein GKIL_1411 [Gloeobacter kilaueensis JS1]
MPSTLSLKDTRQGDVRLQTPLPPLVTYLRGPDHWVPVGFRPLKVQRTGAGHFDLQLPEFGALGFQLAPRMVLQLIEDDECRYRLLSVPSPASDYQTDFSGLFQLTPRPPAVDVFWEARFAIQLTLPGFLGMFPQPVVQSAAQTAVSAMSASVCQNLVHNICCDYRSRHPGA